MGREINGVNVEFSDDDKAFIFLMNYENAPRGCVGYWCEFCYFSSMFKHYFQVDHIVPVARAKDFGLSPSFINSLDNACVLCEACNASKNQYDFPRHGVGLAYRAPNQNMTWGERRAQSLDFNQLVEMAKRKGRYRYRG